MNRNELSDLRPARRRQLLLEELKKQKSLDVARAARQFFVAEATIRRDFNCLAAQGLIRRTYGGAVLLEGLEIPLSAREGQNTSQKDQLCRQAVARISDGDTVFLDSSSTVSRMVKFLRERKNLTVITNGAKTALLLAQLPDARIYCTGGKLRENSLSYTGQAAMDFIRNFYTDVAVFSCRSLSGRGLSDCSEEEGLLRRVVLQCTRKSILLIDRSKVNTDSFFRICGAEEVDEIITDHPDYQKTPESD